MLKNIAKSEGREYEIREPITVSGLKELVKKDFPALAGLIDSRSLLVSVNQEFAKGTDAVKDGDEVGFLPPFSGG